MKSLDILLILWRVCVGWRAGADWIACIRVGLRFFSHPQLRSTKIAYSSACICFNWPAFRPLFAPLRDLTVPTPRTASTGPCERICAEDGQEEHGLAQGVHVQKVIFVFLLTFVIVLMLPQVTNLSSWHSILLQ